MVDFSIETTERFEIFLEKIKDNLFRLKIEKQIKKIIENPEVGKPMMHNRKGTREVYIKPFRLSYAYLKNENKLIFLEIYHKKEQ
jgi:mRNA-degrading endonuclease RelE of RelBE toxin-antitoxin system